MNKKIKAKWVAALRSGKYIQARGALRADNKFCCLGVLCNLHARAHPDIAATQHHVNYYIGSDAVLPKEVQAWADLPNECGGDVKIGNNKDSLAWHNDEGRTFDEIANAIESQL